MYLQTLILILVSQREAMAGCLLFLIHLSSPHWWCHVQVYEWLGVEPPRGVLLHGPPGCGKTDLAHAIANECGVPFLRISAPEIVAGVSGSFVSLFDSH